MAAKDLCEALFDEISKMPVIDTHEHLHWREDEWCKNGDDFLREYLAHYLKSDMLSAGLKQEDFTKAMDMSRSLDERWSIVEPYWEFSRHTGYGRALDISVKGIYGIDGIRRETVEALNQMFLENKKPGHFHRVLKELCGIETSMLDVDAFRANGESPFFKPVWQPRLYVMPSKAEAGKLTEFIKQNHGITVNSLDDWMDALAAEIDHIFRMHGVRVMKTAIAYARTLRFEQVAYHDAKAMFAAALAQWGSGNDDAFPRELQDFMMHHTLKLADERGFTFQFHTGLLEGNGNVLSNSDPALLTNLFLAYPNIDFDLFHIGYPYQGTACALAKMFPNVFVDMCWAHIISPSACVAALDDFLDAIPYNKISAFGGDYLFVDGVYGHLHLSRKNVSRTLAGKIARGVMNTDKALDIAAAMYYENPKRIFKL